MNSRRSMSVRSRILRLIALNSGVALGLAGVGLFAYESIQQRNAAQHEFLAEAGILGENCAAALSFSDPKAANETLSALVGDSRVVEAAVYDETNRLFASYAKPGHPFDRREPRQEKPGAHFRDGTLLVSQPITIKGRQVGTIFMESTNEVYARLAQYIGIVVLVSLFSFALALVFSNRTQKSITQPITELSDIARRVSAHKDYTLQANMRAGGEIGVLVDSFNDMLSQIRANEESLRESEERYALAAKGANDGLWDWKLATNQIYFSPRWTEMLGYPGESWSHPDDWFRHIHASDVERVRGEIHRLLLGARNELTTEYRMRHRNGGYIWTLTRGIAVRDPNGIATRIAGSQTDVTEGKTADPLTGLPNRLYLIDKLESLLEISSRSDALFAVLFLDLDGFKLVNDSLGHAAGDELLMAVAGRLRSVLRNPSTGRQPVIARLGGDEFAILLPDAGDPADAAVTAQEVVRELAVPYHIAGRQVFAGASAGVAMSNSAALAEDLLRNADTAMYYAKTGGKGKFEIFDDRMRQRAVARMEIETGLRKALEEGQLMLHYQAQLSLASRRIVGCEALVRWNHPERGIIGPGEFIPIAEQTDLIVDLGRWVLRTACRQMAEWRKTLPSTPLSISVNVSPKQLRDPDFLKDVEQILAETQLDPASLRLEMTESSIMTNPEATLTTLLDLKKLNIGLEIDDFGTGYSSLSYLQKLPFDTVKVDRSFVKELGQGAESLEIVRTIVDLARSLGMQVVAEGVETEEQLKALSDLGCDYGQGFYFAKPVSSPVALGMIQEKVGFEQDLEALRHSVERESSQSPSRHELTPVSD